MAGYRSKKQMADDRMEGPVSIKIQGLSRKQKLMADLMWSMDDKDQVMTFIKSLSPSDRKQAQVVCELMVLACFDEVDTIEQETIDFINSMKE